MEEKTQWPAESFQKFAGTGPPSAVMVLAGAHNELVARVAALEKRVLELERQVRDG